MTTQDEINQAVGVALNKIGQEAKTEFEEYDIETQVRGTYEDDNWTYKTTRQRVSLEYWFSSFSSRKEDVDITYGTDNDSAKLEKDLRECFDRLRNFVKKRKGIF